MTLDDLVLRRIPEAVKRTRKGHVIGVLAVVVGAWLFAFVRFGYPMKDLGPQQPVPFSHRLHAGVKEIHCRFCHPFVERGPRAGVPEVEKCFYCHDFIIPNHPEIQKERAYLNSGEPVPWVRAFFAYDHVQFQHQPHLRYPQKDGTVGFPCERCHGDVKTMDRLPHVVFKMGFCIKCHRENNANQQCWLACHN
jgi:hypothetical protein